MSLLLPLILVLLAAGYLGFGLGILAVRKPGYSHIRHTISEIGEIGSPVQQFAAFGFFLPIGLLLGVAALLANAASPAVATVALCIAIGYVAAAAFPCDPGSPAAGTTTRQTIHNLGGGVQYIGSGLTLMTLAETFGQPYQIAGGLILGLAVLFSFLPSTSIRGLVQRIAECCLFGMLALALWQLGTSM
jgi:Protein of unknown function (DUF998)